MLSRLLVRALALLLMVGSLTLVVSLPSRLTAQTASGLVGTWRYAGGAVETRGIAHAIDTALADFNPVMREVVAAQLRDTNRAYPEFSIAVEGENIVTRMNGHTLSTPANGAARELTTPEGRSARVTQQMTGNRLVQTLANAQGTRTHTMTLESDGNVRVAVRIVSNHLPRPVAYSLTYSRAN